MLPPSIPLGGEKGAHPVQRVSPAGVQSSGAGGHSVMSEVSLPWKQQQLQLLFESFLRPSIWHLGQSKVYDHLLWCDMTWIRQENAGCPGTSCLLHPAFTLPSPTLPFPSPCLHGNHGGCMTPYQVCCFLALYFPPKPGEGQGVFTPKGKEINNTQ